MSERRRMPTERESLTHKVEIVDTTTANTWSLYITAGMYPDGQVGEIFVRDIGKEGSTIQGLLDAFATMFSIALQHGASLLFLVTKFEGMGFEPCGQTNNPEIPTCTSVIDYIVRWLATRFE